MGYNPGVSPAMLQNDRFLKSGAYVNSNMINFVTSGDPISATSAVLPNYVRSVNLKGRGNPIKRHSIDQFITAIGDYSDREDKDIFGRPVSEAGLVVVPPDFEDIPTHNSKEDSSDDRRVLPIPPFPLIPGIKQGEPIEGEPVLELGEPEAIEMSDIIGSIAQAEEDVMGILPEIDIAGEIAEGAESIGIGTEIAEGLGTAIEVIGLGFL